MGSSSSSSSFHFVINVIIVMIIVGMSSGGTHDGFHFLCLFPSRFHRQFFRFFPFKQHSSALLSFPYRALVKHGVNVNKLSCHSAANSPIESQLISHLSLPNTRFAFQSR